MLEMEPVKFLSEAETIKAISTESKVFSIYATGFVRAGKRETRVRIHSVVDFRGAPPPPEVQLLDRLTAERCSAPERPARQERRAQRAPAPQPAAGGAASNLPEGATESTIAAGVSAEPRRQRRLLSSRVMAKLVGIDIRAGHVRAALVHTSYRRIAVERMVEVDIASIGSVEQALQAAAVPLMADAEALAVALEGDSSFIHRITLPATAAKQIAQVLPFELEAHVPVDIDELVYDYRLLHRAAAEPIVVLTAAARTEHVRERIRLVRAALGREPDRVGCGPLPLANLASVTPELSGPGPIALIDLGGSRTEVVLLSNGEPVFARTLSRGVQGLPQSAPLLAAELRQTFAGWDAHGGTPVTLAYLARRRSGRSGSARVPVEHARRTLGVSAATSSSRASARTISRPCAVSPRRSRSRSAWRRDRAISTCAADRWRISAATVS